VLLWAAVLSPRVRSDSLQALTGLPREAVDLALEAIAEQGILHPGERGLHFSHDLIIRSFYEQIPPARCQLMHHRVAELLEEATALDLQLAADLAHHATRSGDPALAGRAMVSAGKLCLRFYANDDALELYERGMEWAEQLVDSERICLLLDLADIRLSAAPLDDWEASSREYVRLAEQALDYGELATARLGYQMASYVRWLHGDWSDARRDSLQAERVTRNASDEAHILGMGEAAKCLAMLERDLSQADAMAMEASALASRSAVQCSAIPTSLGILRYYEGRLEEAIDHLEDARTICKSQGDRFNEYLANEYLTVVEVEQGDFPAALQHAETLVDIGSRLREGSEYPFALAIQELCRYGLQRDTPELEDYLAAVRQADAKQRLAYLLNRIAMLDIDRGNHRQALLHSEEALQLARLMERPSETLLAHINMFNISNNINGLESKSHVESIAELCRGTVAAWARERADQLLASAG
jgi:tetratricopeptide (TPR) repeat protein